MKKIALLLILFLYLVPALKFTKEKGLMLDQQDKADLVAFLKTLTDYTLISNAKYADPNK